MYFLYTCLALLLCVMLVGEEEAFADGPNQMMKANQVEEADDAEIKRIQKLAGLI